MLKIAGMPTEERYSLGQLYVGQKIIVRQWDGRENSAVIKSVDQDLSFLQADGRCTIDYTTELGGTGWCYLYQVVHAELL